MSIEIELREHKGVNGAGVEVTHAQYIVLAKTDYFGAHIDGELKPIQIGYIGNWRGADFMPINEFRRLAAADQPAIIEVVNAALEAKLDERDDARRVPEPEQAPLHRDEPAGLGLGEDTELDDSGDESLSQELADGSGGGEPGPGEPYPGIADRGDAG